ncbi:MULTISPECIES: hypothetical protein [unclassified Streptomyces]|uniref:hypothetical protein n=1 Tax=unclassified Streptomyces TaxID=2593676 RepID=UPI00278BE1D0|nr:MULTISPECIES: hypothetical protein [unclassified Streptomyces]
MRSGGVRSGGRWARLVVLSVVGLVAVTGCGGAGKVAGDGGDALAERARRVADAWDGSPAATAWRTAGYHPTGEPVRLPRGGLHDGADQQAYERRNFKLAGGGLPGTAPKTGEVTWPSGGASVVRPLVGAEESYDALAGPSDANEPHLSVRAVELGRMTVATSRGPALVPAWIYTLDGYSTPLKQAAAVPSAAPRSPIAPTHDLPGLPLDRFLGASPSDGRKVTVVAIHGVCDKGPAVEALETRGSVVLSATVPDPDPDGERTCTKQGKLERVEVKLREPLGERLLLDALSGRPVPARGLAGLAP